MDNKKVSKDHFDKALKTAIDEAKKSSCMKSHRGAVVFDTQTGQVWGAGRNEPPSPFICDGTCEGFCGKVAIHAEQNAIYNALEKYSSIRGLHLIHIKVVDGQPVPGGPPSCIECSKLIVRMGLGTVWLFLGNLEEAGEWKSYTAEEFHLATMKNLGYDCGLSIYGGGRYSEVNFTYHRLIDYGDHHSSKTVAWLIKGEIKGENFKGPYLDTLKKVIIQKYPGAIFTEGDSYDIDKV